MRTRAAVASVLASLAVLVGGWQLGSAGATGSPLATGTSATTATNGTAPATTTPTPAGTPTPTTPAAPSAGAAADPSADASSMATASPSASADGTWTGSSVATRFGAVQVAITVAGGQITEVTAVHLTDKDGRSVSISHRAAPILRQEVLAAQSAHVQAVSGATYTSDGYLTSLQSAIDQAGL
ncbi:FMN-binding protein [Rathayibacter sp. VKM Ac-2929]|uniref:FMN-binding protein n=1 Tax=Rathayibacter sp. VKM Ac-2929 TaxID=2929480 RepID=UPI001FB2B64B|nr:FMN-binding protein [Rathayibacter sp. VKM Ac-2929]MCJ1675614.1 FMN-binding protein [Rathayibacter sp. VKM Ac-2929]